MDEMISSPSSTSYIRHSNITNFTSLMTRKESREKNISNGDIEEEISSRISFESGISNDSDSTTMNGYDHLYAAGTFDESQAHYSVNDVGPRYSNEKEGECEEKILPIIKKVNSSSMNEPLSPILLQNKSRFSKQADIMIKSLLSMPSHDDEVYIVEGYGSSSEEELDENIDSGLSFDKENIERELNSICGQDLYSDSTEDDYERASCRDKNERKHLDGNLIDTSLVDRRCHNRSFVNAPHDNPHQKEDVNPLGFETILESRDETNFEIAAKRNMNCVTLQERDEAIEAIEENSIVSNGVYLESSPSHRYPNIDDEAISLRTRTNAPNRKSSSKKQKFHIRTASKKYSDIVEQPLLKKSSYCRKSRSQYKLNSRTPIVKRLMRKAIRSPFFSNGHDLRQMKYQVYSDTFHSGKEHYEISASRDSDILSRSNQNVSLPIPKDPSTVEIANTDNQDVPDPNIKGNVVQEASILSSDVHIYKLGHDDDEDVHTEETCGSLDCNRRSSGNLDHQIKGFNSVLHVKKNKCDWLDPINNNCERLCQDKVIDDKYQGEWGNMKEREVNSNIVAPDKSNYRGSLGSDSSSVCPLKTVTKTRDQSIRKSQVFHSEMQSAFEEISSTRSPSGLKSTENPKTHDPAVKDNNLPTSRKHVRGVSRRHIDNAISDTSTKSANNALSIENEYLHGLGLEVVADANIFRTKGCLETRNTCGLNAGGAGLSTIRVPPKYINMQNECCDFKVNSSSVASAAVEVLCNDQRQHIGCESSNLNPTNNLNSSLISGYLHNELVNNTPGASDGVSLEEEGIELCLGDEKNSRKRYFDKTTKDKSYNPQTTSFLSIDEEGHNTDCKTEPKSCPLTKPRVRVGNDASHMEAAGTNFRMDQLVALQKMSNGDNGGDSFNYTNSTQKQKIDDFCKNRSVDTKIEINAQNKCLGERAHCPLSYDTLANRTSMIAPKEVNVYDESHICSENDFKNICSENDFKNPPKSTENAIFLRRQQYRGDFSQNYYNDSDKMKVDTSNQSSLGTQNKTNTCRQTVRSWPAAGSKRLSSSLTNYSSYLDTTHARCNGQTHEGEGVAIVCTPEKSIEDKACSKKSPKDIIQQIISGQYSKFENKSSRVATKEFKKLGNEDRLILDVPVAAPLVDECRKGHPKVIDAISEQHPGNSLKKESSVGTIKIDELDKDDNNLINASPKIQKTVKDRINYFNLSDETNLASFSNDLQRFSKAVPNRETRVKAQRIVELPKDSPKVSRISSPKVQHIGKNCSSLLTESVTEKSENASIKRQSLANSSKIGTDNIRVEMSNENGMIPSNGLVLPGTNFYSYKSKTKKDTEKLEKQSYNELINASPKIQKTVKDRINFLNLRDKTNLASFSDDFQQSSKAFPKRETRVGDDAKAQRIVELPKDNPKVSGISSPKVQYIGKSCSPLLTRDYLIDSMLPSVDNVVDKIEDASIGCQDTICNAIEVSPNKDLSRSKALQFWTRAKHEAQEGCI